MILHANWLPDSAVISLWLEDETSELAPVTAKRSVHRGASPLHPFSVGSDELMERLPDELEPFSEEQILLLPTVSNTPVLSCSEVPDHARIVPWTIETAEVLAECFFDVIYGQGPATLQMEGVQWGPDMLFWYELARFGRLLYEDRLYAPGVVELEGKIYPSWHAAFTEQAEEHWKLLLKAMPPICRALDSEDDKRQHDPSQLALSFLDASIDTLARHRRMRRSPRQVSLKRSSSPLHRQWLNTLKYGQFQVMNGNPASLHQFAADVHSWTEFMRPAFFDMPWRLAFELVAPEVEIGSWRVQFALASVKNPEQKLTANQIWSESSVKQYVPLAREVLFTGLGMAVEVFPEIKESLDTAEPEGIELNRNEAGVFMVETAPALRRLGFFVNLPNWWDDSHDMLGMRLKIRAGDSSTPDRDSFLGVNNLVDYKWEVALGDQTLEEDEFRELAELKHRLIFRQGRWYRLDVDALNNSIEFIDRKGRAGQNKLSKVLKLGSEIEKSGGLPILDFDLDDRMVPFSAGFDAKQTFEALEQPEGFVGHMPRYQVFGFSWMVFIKNLGLGACLADDMGLGKTIQMIAVLIHETARDPDYGPTLIVSPMSVVGNWAHEFKRFAPHLRVMVHHGSDREGREEFLESVKHYHAVISTYNLVVRDHLCFKGCEWENIVLDEAQNIKNPTTKQATVIRSLKSRHRFCLTGTPIENRLTELWSLMDFLNPGYLGTLSSFRSTFSQPIERDQDRTRSRMLQRIIRPFILRRLKSDKEIVRDLPEKSEMKVFCNLTTEQAGLYQAVVDEMMGKIRSSHGIERKGLVLATLTKLKQITNHPTHFLRDGSPFTSARSGKLQRLEEMLEVVLDSGDKALIFSQFTEIGEAMRSKLQDSFQSEVLYLHGGTSKSQRDEMVHRFQHPNGPPIFLLSLKAGGVGLNLTAANHVFHFDRWWNPAIEDQATDRTYRIGQEKNVQVHKFICVGTVEEKIDQMIEDKKRLAENIVTAGESMLTELTTEELQEVFSLSRDAVVE